MAGFLRFFRIFVANFINLDMNFTELRTEINSCITLDFQEASSKLQQTIFSLRKADILKLIVEIGTIPEDIAHDSTEEKLYTKASDILFAKALQEMNLEVKVLTQRADCADIVAQSHYHNYSLVGDAKAFRLSRTAKNAKDFKVTSMAHWRGDCDYSVLACPYYQYPKSSSQIYKDALDNNISLFSWEYLYMLLKEGVVESPSQNLKELFNQSAVIANKTSVGNAKANFLLEQNKNIADIINMPHSKFISYFDSIKKMLIKRGYTEISYYENEINRVKQLNREDAINELLMSMKLDSKNSTIKQFIEQIKK